MAKHPSNPDQILRIGLISDTHGFLDPKIPSLFGGVSHILHAGDIGNFTIIRDLENIAPTTAVIGNTDVGLDYRETEVIVMGGQTFLLHHIVDRNDLDRGLEQQIQKAKVRIVVFGHTHQQCRENLNGCLFLNPGYSGRPKFQQPRSVAILSVIKTEITVEFLPL